MARRSIGTSDSSLELDSLYDKENLQPEKKDISPSHVRFRINFWHTE